MASPAVETKQSKWTTRERPWLVPWNRKLRHVQAVALRNLALSPTNALQRGKVIDDDALPNTLKSPAKQLALRESRLLGHSKSSDDLRPIHEDKDKAQDASRIANGSPQAPAKEKKVRPGAAKLRRRSTLEWASESPQSRQTRLEAVSAARLADVFFTLHVGVIDSPVYVSEEVTKTMNPTFKHIDWDSCGPGIMRQEDVRIKVWARSGADRHHQILMDMSLNLRSLQFIGKDLAAFNHPFPQNCILFQLSDGWYTCFTDARVSEPSDPFADARAKPSTPRTIRSASFDALLRLSKLDDSIQDALSLRDRLASDLSSIVESNREALEHKNRVSESKDYLKTINYARTTVEKQLRHLRQTLSHKRDALQTRRDAIATGRATQSTEHAQIRNSISTFPSLHDDLTALSRSITNQRRRIAHDLGTIYPIAPMASKPLSFTIRALHLPDSEDLATANPDTIAAALGHVTHALQLLSFYLSQALPYVPHPRSSTSSMTDPISALNGAGTGPHTASSSAGPIPTSSSSSVVSCAPPPPPSLADPARSFPLHPRSNPRYRAEYALFLLNKDIQVLLSNAFNVRVLDIRQTLPNLAYVLACMGAGEGELPGRKMGGVRGLARTVGEGRGWGTAIGVRRDVVVASEGKGEEVGSRGSGMTREEFESGRWAAAAADDDDDERGGVWDGSVRVKGRGDEEMVVKGREGG